MSGGPARRYAICGAVDRQASMCATCCWRLHLRGECSVKRRATSMHGCVLSPLALAPPRCLPYTGAHPSITAGKTSPPSTRRYGALSPRVLWTSWCQLLTARLRQLGAGVVWLGRGARSRVQTTALPAFSDGTSAFWTPVSDHQYNSVLCPTARRSAARRRNSGVAAIVPGAGAVSFTAGKPRGCRPVPALHACGGAVLYVDLWTNAARQPFGVLHLAGNRALPEIGRLRHFYSDNGGRRRRSR